MKPIFKKATFTLFFILPLAFISSNAYATRTTADLIALYTLDEGFGTTIYDTSGVTPLIELTNTTPTATAWIAGGLRANSTTAVSNETVSTKIITACMTSNELTLEAWVQPANLTQEGPARIITHSLNSSERNFTLGQQCDQFVFRVRTTDTNLNGGPELFAGTVTTNLTHIVATRASSGQVVVYVDSIAVSTTSITGDFSNWDTSNYGLALFNEVNISDRRWWGDMHLVAVYSRALNSAEVLANFTAGANPSILTVTVSPTTSPTPSHSPTFTATPSHTLTATQSATLTASASPTLTATQSATVTVSATETLTPTESATLTPTPSITLTPTESATFTATPSISATATISPSMTPSPTSTTVQTTTSTPALFTDQSKRVIAYPQPLRGDKLHFAIQLTNAATVTANIYNVSGEKIKTLTEHYATAGVQQLIWNATDVAPAVYLYQIKITKDNGKSELLPFEKVVIIKIR